MALPHLHTHADAHGHSHGHSHGLAGQGDRQVALAVAVNIGLSLAQLVGGVISGSVALIADAMHNFSDGLALVLAFAARRIARRPATPQMSFGYGRAEVVAALINYTVLVLISVWLGYEAVTRLFDPQPVTGWIVIALAGLGLLVNSATALLTFRLARESLNIRAAFLHNLSDAATSVAVIAGGVVIALYGWRLVDPLLTLAISVWISVHALSEMGPVIRILMLAAPSDPAPIRARLVAEPDVEEVHHLHLWQIDERRASVEAHLVLREGADFAEVIRRVKAVVMREFGISHATFEAETRAEGCAGPGCEGPGFDGPGFDGPGLSGPEFNGPGASSPAPRA